jgi:nitrogen fixation protein FixH
MSLWLSLFGGMTLTALLYGAGRFLRLSNFWASVLACGLPSVLYLVLAVTTWPGLDVVTLHLVAFPTVAVLLFQLYGAKAHHALSLHWAPKLMIGFFVVITVLYGGMIYIAGQGLPPSLAHIVLPNTQGKNLHTGFAGVVAHKQEDAAKGIGQHLRNEHLLRQLGWKVEVTGLNNLRAGVEGDVMVRVLDPSGQGVDSVTVELALARPGDRPGAMTRLNPVGAGTYHARLHPNQSGTWVVFTMLGHADQVVRLEHTLEIN